MTSNTHDRVASAAIVAGLGARAWWGLAEHHPRDYLVSDMAGYVERGARIAEGAPLDRYDVFEPTGTQLLVALPMWIFGTGDGGLWAAAVLWVLLSAATPFFIWRLARVLWGPRVGAVGAVIAAAFPLFVLHTGYFMSETPALAFLMGALWLGYRARTAADPAVGSALAGGLLAGGAVACRAQLGLNLAVLALPWFLRRERRRHLAAYAGAAAAVAAAVIAFNSAAADRLVFLGENGGLVFFEGACDVGYMAGGTAERPFYFIPPPRREQERGRSYTFPGVRVYDQAFWYERSWECIRENGLAHAGVMARNAIDMTATSTPWPEYDDGGPVRAIAFWSNLAWCLAFPALVGAVLFRRLRRGSFGWEGAMLAQLLLFVVVGAIFFGDPRYRMLYDGAGLVLAAGLLGTRNRWIPPGPGK